MPRGPWIIALLLVVRACRADSEGCCGGNDDGCGGLLEIGDGDCDSDDDCAGALVCGADNCGRDEGFDTSAWPPESYCGWDTTDDCCCRVAADGSCTTLAEDGGANACLDDGDESCAPQNAYFLAGSAGLSVADARDRHRVGVFGREKAARARAQVEHALLDGAGGDEPRYRHRLLL